MEDEGLRALGGMCGEVHTPWQGVRGPPGAGPEPSILPPLQAPGGPLEFPEQASSLRVCVCTCCAPAGNTLRWPASSPWGRLRVPADALRLSVYPTPTLLSGSFRGLSSLEAARSLAPGRATVHAG